MVGEDEMSSPLVIFAGEGQSRLAFSSAPTHLLVPLICPDCSGPLWDLRDEKRTRYRCRLGHAFTEEALLAGQSETIEQALWAAVRTMEDRMRA
jgi:hypothetical protein